jgi:hypothetical protein
VATAEAKVFATSGSKGSHHRTASVGAAGQDPCSSQVSSGASDQEASVAAWLRLVKPLGFAGWGSQNMTEASSGSLNGTWIPAAVCEVGHHLLQLVAIVGVVARL